MIINNFDPDCQYKNNCKSRGRLCNNCKHNKKQKDDYYEPRGPIIPWSPTPTPLNPWRVPYYPTVTFVR